MIAESLSKFGGHTERVMLYQASDIRRFRQATAFTRAETAVMSAVRPASAWHAPSPCPCPADRRRRWLPRPRRLRPATSASDRRSRHVGRQHCQLGLFLVGQVLAAAGFELADRVLALLDQLVDDASTLASSSSMRSSTSFCLMAASQQADGAQALARPWRAWRPSCLR